MHSEKDVLAARSEGVAVGVFALNSHLDVSGVERGKTSQGYPMNTNMKSSNNS